MNAFAKTGAGLLWLVATAMISVPQTCAQQSKPNILVIMGDDIGYWNISAYNRGMMGYRTPNIDRINVRSDPFERSQRAAKPRRLFNFCRRLGDGP